MNNVSVVLELFFQLENLYKHYYKLITNKSSLFSEETAEEIAEYAKNIKVLFMVIKQEIQKCNNLLLIYLLNSKINQEKRNRIREVKTAF